MSTSEFNLDSPITDIAANNESDSIDKFLGTAISDGDIELVPFIEEGYDGTVDYRIRQLSYSSLLTLHSCPRKFQLQKLRAKAPSEALDTSITFSFGHVVGEGIQAILEGKSLDQVYFEMYISWHTPSIFDEDIKRNKSLWSAYRAIAKFFNLRDSLLEDYELVYYNGKPACELSFSIQLPDSFRLRGFVDAVLKHKHSGKVVVLECKTTGLANVNPATYKNSAQAIGYSVVLDHLFPELSSYEVLYLVYSTKPEEYTAFSFHKTYLQRALWIRELLLDIEAIKRYAEEDLYPMRGESCFSYNRECSFFNTCTLSTSSITLPMTADMEDKTDYQVNITLLDLLETQIEKAST